MINIPTTSYNNNDIQELITSFVKSLDIKCAAEIGTQRGCSAALICKGMDKEDREFHSCDLFEEKYRNPPYLATHASKEETEFNLSKLNLKCKWNIHKSNDIELLEIVEDIELLHIDICNHYDNIRDILIRWNTIVKKAIILEGGNYNHWQKKYGFKPWYPILEEEWFSKYWSYITIEFNNGNAVTFCIRKSIV